MVQPEYPTDRLKPLSANRFTAMGGALRRVILDPE